MTETAGQALSSSLLERLQVQDGEIAVVTLAAHLRDEGEPVLRYGSLLIGPPELAQQSWPEWSAAEGDEGSSVLTSLLASAGRPLEQWRAFDEVVQGWRLVRFPLDLADVGAWLDRCVHSGVVDVPGSPVVHAALEVPTALVRVFRHQETATGGLTAMACRPLTGWLHRCADVDDDQAVLPPQEWRVSPDHHVTASTLLLTGLSGRDVWTGRPPASGLFVGRMQRRAWIVQLRGSHDLTSFDVHLRLDPARVSLWELVLDLEEYDDHGDLLSARRVALADLAVPDHGPERFTVQLPTLGRRVVRRLRLYDREGVLLDGADGVRIVESIDVSIRLMDGPVVSGPAMPNPSAPDLRSRMTAVDRVEDEYRDSLQAGVDSRVVLSRKAGRAELQKRLGAARGELLVFDPYFGDADDWALLHGVQVPIRVLASRRAVIPTGTGAQTAGLLVKRWDRASLPPFHDRAFLWSGGGLTVGTSANGLGARLSLIDLVEAPLSAHLAQRFDVWWTDPRFRILVEAT